eukprot:422324-Prorocentrum_minimum.AAC.2
MRPARTPPFPTTPPTHLPIRPPAGAACPLPTLCAAPVAAVPLLRPVIRGALDVVVLDRARRSTTCHAGAARVGDARGLAVVVVDVVVVVVVVVVWCSRARALRWVLRGRGRGRPQRVRHIPVVRAVVHRVAAAAPLAPTAASVVRRAPLRPAPDPAPAQLLSPPIIPPPGSTSRDTRAVLAPPLPGRRREAQTRAFTPGIIIQTCSAAPHQPASALRNIIITSPRAWTNRRCLRGPHSRVLYSPELGPPLLPLLFTLSLARRRRLGTVPTRMAPTILALLFQSRVLVPRLERCGGCMVPTFAPPRPPAATTASLVDPILAPGVYPRSPSPPRPACRRRRCPTSGGLNSHARGLVRRCSPKRAGEAPPRGRPNPRRRRPAHFRPGSPGPRSRRASDPRSPCVGEMRISSGRSREGCRRRSEG